MKTHCGGDICEIGDAYSLENCSCACDRCGFERNAQISALRNAETRNRTERREFDARIRNEPRLALVFLLTRIGSWTSARFDQHVRYEYGDEVCDALLAWLAANVDESLSKDAINNRYY